MIALLLASCAFPESDYARRERLDAEREAAWSDRFREVKKAPVWRGTVLRHKDGVPIVDLGSGVRYAVHFAHIWRTTCASNDREYNERVAALLPVASPVVAVRSQPLRWEDGWMTETGVEAFVYPGDDEEPTGLTVNETLVAEGLAKPEPFVAPDDPARVERIDKIERSLSPLNFRYWKRFDGAWMRGWNERSGLIGECRSKSERRAAYLEQRHEDYWDEVREAEERRRRWERNHPYDPSCDGDGDGVCYE